MLVPGEEERVVIGLGERNTDFENGIQCFGLGVEIKALRVSGVA